MIIINIVIIIIIQDKEDKARLLPPPLFGVLPEPAAWSLWILCMAKALLSLLMK